MPNNTDIFDELSTLIWAYVEREAGRNVSLSPEDELRVRKLLLRDLPARALADGFRDVDTGLNEMFLTFGNIPVNDDLMQRIHDQNEAVEPEKEKATADNVIHLESRTSND